MMEAVKRNGDALGYASGELKADKKFMKEAVKQDGCAFRDASDELKADREVVMEAVKQNGDVLEYEYVSVGPMAHRACCHNRVALVMLLGMLLIGAVLMMEVVAQQSGHGEAITYTSEEQKADKGTVTKAVMQYGGALGCECISLRGRPREPD